MFLAASNLPTAALLTDFVWVFGVGALVVALLHTRKLPSLLGFLITGLLVGPAGFGLVQDRAAIEVMAELGIVLLLFTIGLEVSLKELARIARQVIGGGVLQIAATTAAVTALAHVVGGLAFNSALAVGLIASASSTALVLRLLGDRGELRLPHGELSLSILLFQDFAVVILMLVLPMLAAGEVVPTALLATLGRAVAISVGIVVVARFVFPWVLARVVDLRSREVFLLASVVAVFGTAWVADAAGLSLALGAFLAGLVISESEFSHQMTAEVMPFRDVLNGLFFVSVGLLIDRDVLFGNLGLLVGIALGALILKAAIVYVTGRAFRLERRAALLAGIALSQIGEFALVLAQQAASLELISSEQHSMLISVSVMTMLTTPLVLPFAGRLLASTPTDAPVDDASSAHDLNDHVIVVGFGINGQNVARALRQLNVKYMIVEMNRATVLQAREDGFPIVFGNATTSALLHHLHVEKARALVSCIADAAATRDIVASAHHANPELLIIARTRYVAEIETLRALGADSVVPEEFETSVELIGRVMRAYGAPESAIHREKHNLRAEHYRALLEDAPPETHDFSHLLEHVATMEVIVGAKADGSTFTEIDLRRKSGATAIAILRDAITHPAPDGSFELRQGDRVILIGDANALDGASRVLTRD